MSGSQVRASTEGQNGWTNLRSRGLHPIGGAAGVEDRQVNKRKGNMTSNKGSEGRKRMRRPAEGQFVPLCKAAGRR